MARIIFREKTTFFSFASPVNAIPLSFPTFIFKIRFFDRLVINLETHFVSVAFFAFFFVLSASAGAGEWIKDPETQCSVWNEHPSPNEKIQYVGSCKNGKANGHGKLSFLENNEVTQVVEGDYLNGKQVGFATVSDLENGKVVLTYRGHFRNDLPFGQGRLESRDYLYEGGFKQGEFHGFGKLSVNATEKEWVLKLSADGSGKLLDDNVFAVSGYFQNNELILECDSVVNCNKKLAKTKEKQLEEALAAVKHNLCKDVVRNFKPSKDELEDSAAYLIMGWKYESSCGVQEENLEEAKNWYRKASERGNKEAQKLLEILNKPALKKSLNDGLQKLKGKYIQVEQSDSKETSAVGLIQMSDRRGTAFLVDPDGCYAFTSSHIMDEKGQMNFSDESARSASLWFGSKTESTKDTPATASDITLDHVFETRVEGNIVAWGLHLDHITNDQYSDWAIVLLGRCIGNQYGYLKLAPYSWVVDSGLGSNGLSFSYGGETIATAIGYPGTKRLDKVTKHYCVLNDFRYGRYYSNDCPVEPGTSGGPLIYQHEGDEDLAAGNYVVGISEKGARHNKKGAYFNVPWFAQMAFERYKAAKKIKPDKAKITRHLNHLGYSVRNDEELKAAIRRFQWKRWDILNQRSNNYIIDAIDAQIIEDIEAEAQNIIEPSSVLGEWCSSDNEFDRVLTILQWKNGEYTKTMITQRKGEITPDTISNSRNIRITTRGTTVYLSEDTKLENQIKEETFRISPNRKLLVQELFRRVGSSEYGSYNKNVPTYRTYIKCGESATGKDIVQEAKQNHALETVDWRIPSADHIITSEGNEFTPISLPGAIRITTEEMTRLTRNKESVIIAAHDGEDFIPTAVPAQWLAGSNYNIYELSAFLRDVTSNDKKRAVVFYCTGPLSWSSYNAGLRALKQGYENVFWYRGGMDAWKTSGRSVVKYVR